MKFVEKTELLIDLLIKKQNELNVTALEYEDTESESHIICHRESDDTFIVWTSYYTNEAKTSYQNFFNGKYDIPTLELARQEVKRRMK